jgi:hypothetical protein
LQQDTIGVLQVWKQSKGDEIMTLTIISWIVSIISLIVAIVVAIQARN